VSGPITPEASAAFYEARGRVLGEDPPDEPTCRVCDGPVPPPGRSLCSDVCRRKRKAASVRAAMAKWEAETGQTWHARYGDKRRAHARANHWRRRYPGMALAEDARRRSLTEGGETFSPQEVFDRDEWVCGLCGVPIPADVRHPDPRSASVDHVVPLARGGAHTRENVQAHLACNLRKGARA
jgi:5-methylcytosine-specific restriction endonuclease McrA